MWPFRSNLIWAWEGEQSVKMGWVLSKFRKSKSTMEILTKLENDIKNIVEFKVRTKNFKQQYRQFHLSGEHSTDSEEGCRPPRHLQHSNLSPCRYFCLFQTVSCCQNYQGKQLLFPWFEETWFMKMFSGPALIIVAISCCPTSHMGPKKVADMVVSQVRQCLFKISN